MVKCAFVCIYASKKDRFVAIYLLLVFPNLLLGLWSSVSKIFDPPFFATKRPESGLISLIAPQIPRHAKDLSQQLEENSCKFFLGALILAASGRGSKPAFLTQHYDNARTGQNTNETILNPPNVSGANELRKNYSTLPVTGYVYGAAALHARGRHSGTRNPQCSVRGHGT